MRTLTLYYTHKPGGFCKRLYRLLNALADAGHDAHYLSLDDPGEAISPLVHFHRIPFPLRRRSGLLFWALFTLWAPIYTALSSVRLRPERLVVFGAYYSTASLLASKIRKVPTVLFLRSLVFKINEITNKPRWVSAVSASIDKIGITHASKVIVMSSAMKKDLFQFLGRELHNVEMLPNDIPDLGGGYRKSTFKPGGMLRAVASGVLDERKNTLFLIRIFSTLQREFGAEKVSLTILGAGPLFESLKQIVKDEGISCCRLVGWVSDPSSYLRNADIFIHPALHEGASNALLEALGSGLPVLVSDISEHREIFPAAELLFSPRDPNELLARLRAILRGEVALNDLTDQALTLTSALRFDWNGKAVSLIRNNP